jgi:hypothetical protein
VPWIKDATGSTIAPMFFLAACLVVAAILVLFVGRMMTHASTLRDGTGSGTARL